MRSLYLMAPVLVLAAAVRPTTADMQPIGSMYDAPYAKGSMGTGFPGASGAGPITVTVQDPVGPFRPGDAFRTFRVDVGESTSATAYVLDSPTAGMARSSKETGWLYQHFLDDTLDDYVSSYSDTLESNVALQRAIWYAEGRWVDAGGRPASLRGEALLLWNAAAAHASQTDGVGVAFGSSQAANSRFVLTANPEPALQFLVPLMPPPSVVPAPGAVVLGLCGLGLVGWGRRRLA